MALIALCLYCANKDIVKDIAKYRALSYRCAVVHSGSKVVGHSVAVDRVHLVELSDVEAEILPHDPDREVPIRTLLLVPHPE